MFIQVNKLVKRLKTPLIIFLLLVTVFSFRYSILSLIQSEDVKGWKYIGLDVDGGTTNGFTYFVFNSFYTKTKSGNTKDWRQCKKLHKFLNGYLSSTINDWESNGNYWYISEANSRGYHAYIQTNGRLIYVEGFADFNGDIPSGEEKKVCVSGQ